MTVLRGFIAGANSQYRKAGLDEYQMRVHADGSVTTPRRPAPEFKQVPGTGSAAGEQASAGAAPAPSAGAAPKPAADPNSAPRAGSAPQFTALKPTATGFALRWEAIPGATQYGVWLDGVLVGHVPKPAFDGALTAGTGGVVQIDAVAADGTRTPLTAPMHVARDAKGKLAVTNPKPAPAQAPAAPAPAQAPAATAPAAAAS